MNNIAKKRTSLVSGFLVLLILVFYLANYNYSKIGKIFCVNSLDSSMKYGISIHWLDRYKIEVNDPADVDSDMDHDGLTLLNEYKNLTDPLDADTDKDGYNDGKEVRDGYNPRGEGRTDKDKDDLPDFWEEENGLSLENNDYNLDPDGDNLPNYLEYAHLTNPLKADTDGDGYTDSEEIKNGYDPAQPGDARLSYQLIINKIGATAPIIWSASDNEELMQEDLKKGVIIYPQTGVPGQSGNTVISGHSSNYTWVAGDYNYIFQDINSLGVGDEIVIKAAQNNGRTFEYKFKVSLKKVTTADDPQIFQKTTNSTLTISTCWPLGTRWKRLIVKAELQ